MKALEILEQLGSSSSSGSKSLGDADEDSSTAKKKKSESSGLDRFGGLNLWGRLSKQLLAADSEDDVINDVNIPEKNIMTLLTNEDQLIHLQKMRKDLVKMLLKEMTPSGKGTCPHCGRAKVRTRKDGDNVKVLLDTSEDISAAAAEKAAGKGSKASALIGSRRKKMTTVYVTPSRVLEHLREVWAYNATQREFLEAMYSSRTVKGLPINGPEMFFVEVVPVPPNRFRPVVELGGLRSEHPHTARYKRIVLLNNTLTEINAANKEKKKEETTEENAAAAEEEEKAKARKGPDRISVLVQLQQAMNELVVGGDPSAPPGVKQELEKKEGLFRKHMMGKRVNFAARSVISPDPYIDTNEIGLPLYFCKRLSYPEPVTARNVERLRRCVLNGPDVYPGANYIEDEYGNRIDLHFNAKSRKSEAARLLTVDAAAPRRYKTVYRHLRDGDMALVNRQPTLHKPGIMAHSVKVLENERTIRMHYSNCNTYNADFDGDEMNVHVPQGEMARAEAQFIAFTDQQYLVPKDGTPLRGLIQDSVFSGVLLTKRDTFFIRTEFQQLLYGCLFNVNTSHPIATPMPTILKPKRLWTGKQIVNNFTHILLHIHKWSCSRKKSDFLSQRFRTLLMTEKSLGTRHVLLCSGFMLGIIGAILFVHFYCMSCVSLALSNSSYDREEFGHPTCLALIRFHVGNHRRNII